MTQRAFVFPGQGSQFVGMGRDLAAAFSVAKDIFQEVDDVLGQNLATLMFEGPEAELNMTENAQPALMTVSMAVMAVLGEAGVNIQDACVYAAGHSLGEYSALTAAGALEIAETAKLLKARGQAMQKAVPVGQGAMAAILGLDLPDIQKLLAETAGAEVCDAANDNSPGQVVISGHGPAVQKVMALALERGAKKAIPLALSVPAHCALMSPAADVMRGKLAEAALKAPVVPVVCNVSAQGERDPEIIRGLLVQQITGLVRWRESVMWMSAQGVTEMVEIGAGKVLSGLIRRIDKDIACESVGTPEQIQALIARLKA